jgi:hypothetical protein
MLLRVAAFAFFFSGILVSRAQVALDQTLPATTKIAPSIKEAPNSAWLDLRQNTPVNARPQTAPNWVEAVTIVPAATPGKTVFRIRLSRPNDEARILLFRLFFDDNAQQPPELIAWDESGSQVLRSGPLGAGINLPSSATVMVPMIGVSAIDVEVPGDGKSVRGAYLDWMKSSEIMHPINAEQDILIPEPFAAAAPLHASDRDTELFGTVTATLAAETLRIGPSVQTGAAFQFGIEAQPLLALLTFEVASPEVATPPEIFVNGEDVGAAVLALPDLADPGYRGIVASLAQQMHFEYTGWLRAQKLVPASVLKTGTNDLIIISGAGTPASAIRATQIQLKYLWDKSDYLLQPTQ